jgi:hypothetical protein
VRDDEEEEKCGVTEDAIGCSMLVREAIDRFKKEGGPDRAKMVVRFEIKNE